MKNDIIISHIRKSDGGIQTNEEHSKGVAALAEKFTQELGMPQWGLFLGMLHDKGKEKKDFQAYIRLMNGMDTACVSYTDKTHAYVGALLARQMFQRGYPFVAFALAGHHAGMPDYDHLDELLRKPLPKEISFEGIPDTPVPPASWKSMEQADVNHLFRILYSCLVDADYLDTEYFMAPDKAALRGNKTPLTQLFPLLEKYLKELADGSSDTPVNRIRKQVQDACRKAGNWPTGVYSLTVPTGGGKTLSSVLWAFLHAIHTGKKRIILSIPFTSIISQTASILKRIFGEENVLEHHSNLNESNADKEEETTLMKKLATENWDFPIIVTTNVQLLESMYASHPASCRKLHNIAHSVILFDEAQTLPGERLQPIVDALKTYHRFFDVSLLFTTASQPTLEGMRPGHRKDLRGFEEIKEIIPPSWKLHDKLRRVDLHFNDCPLDYQDIACRMMQEHRVLCIVNTRKDAGEIFSRLEAISDGSALHFHLSRMMCAAHLDSTLAEIKDALKKNEDVPIRVVSTQLVEAGVDMDFPVVWRQEAGLDSILQAAGRCNREGKLAALGKTEVFKIHGRNVPKGTLNFANQARLNMPEQDDWFAPQAMTDYFTHFYHQIPTFDKKEEVNGSTYSIQELLYSPQKMMFDSADCAFRLIDSKGYSVVVHYQESNDLIEQLRKKNVDASIYRRLNRYAVNLNEKDFRAFVHAGMIEEVAGLFYLSDKNQYDEKVGLNLNNHWLDEILIQ